MKKVAFMFPGQGSQKVGMTKEIYEKSPDIQSLYHQGNEILGEDLVQTMFEGPNEKLTKTENAQPALLLSSIAIFHLLRDHVQPVMTVGHSLGEYSALVAAGSLTLEEALPLVRARGQLMEEAFPKGQGSMAAVLGMSKEEIETSLSSLDEIVDIANYNCPGQIVISGTKTGIEEATRTLKDAGAKRVLPLNVSGPFHSRLMKEASEKFTDYLDRVNIQNATIPVYANVTAAPVTQKEMIKELLIKQLYSPVQFEQSILQMMEDEDLDAFIEVGSGTVLCGLLKKINRNMKTFAVHNIDSLENFLDWYGKESS